MKVEWIIENIAKEQSYTELAKSVKKLGFDLLELNGDYKKELLEKYNSYCLEPFNEGYSRNCVIFNGSIEMAKLIRADLNKYNQPVIYSNFQKYQCSYYYSHFGEYLFNDVYTLISLSELNRNKFFYYGIFGKEALIFLRPNSGEKLFQAQLLDILDFDRFYSQNEHLKHELVLVSTPKNIKWEGRIVVSKYKDIISHSTYRFQGQITKIPSIPPGAKELVIKLLEIDYYPDSVFCYDLCENNDGEFNLLELTSFSSAGLYSCDMDKIVGKISEIAWKDFMENNPNNV